MSGLMIDADRCVGCKRCMRACAFGGIVVEGRLARPTDACTLCGSCVDACPVQAISIDRGHAAVSDGAGSDSSVCRDIWVAAQLDAAGAVLPVTFELIAKARELAQRREPAAELSAASKCRVVALLAESPRPASQAPRLLEAGADEVLRCQDERFAQLDSEVWAAWVCGLAEGRRPETVLFGATAFGRELAPRVAVKLQTGLTADCTVLSIDPETGMLQQTRPAFGGNLMATIECPVHRPQMATVRPGVFSALEATSATSRSAGTVTDVELDATVQPRVRRLDVEPVAGGTIAQAKRLVVVGRGIGSKKHLPLMKRLAELLDADLGCTRPLVENGWLDYAHQVGQTGASVAPELLLSLGVSGAIQHLAGMGGAQTVIAVNEDSSAPIFGAARYAVVGDCVEFAEELVRQLESR